MTAASDPRLVPILSKLNAPQREAVLHKNGPLLILAGAGSGKTTTMASRIAYLIAKHHIPARNILGLSFTRKAAQELKERVHKMVAKAAGARASKGITLSTFHALAVRLLRAEGHRLGFAPNFSILDQNDQTDIVKAILKQIKVDDRKFDVDVIRFEIGQAKNRFLGGDEAQAFFLASKRMPEDYAIITANVYEKYQERLKQLNSLDFDDLLFQCARLLEDHLEARVRFNHQFRYILVDEYQDTNPAQFKLLRLLTETQQNLCVVGDDDQSIYGWRGADSTHILEFSHQFPGAKVITLDQNYRSTNRILGAANQVISRNKKRHPKTLWSDQGEGEPITQMILEEDRAEADAVAEELLRMKNDPEHARQHRDFAILYRSNPQSRLFEEALRMRKIPYKIVGTLSFLERKEIKDCLSYLRVVQNEKDDASARRIINYPARGIGKATIDALGTYALANEVSMYEACRRLASAPAAAGGDAAAIPELSPKAREALARFRDLIEGARADLASLPTDPTLVGSALSSWAKRVFERIGLRAAIQAECEDDPAQAGKRWENVEEIANALGQIDPEHLDAAPADESEAPVATAPLVLLTEFLNRMTLDPSEDDDEKDENRDEVTLLTLHGSKGLEWPVVFLVGMEEGLLPHRRTIEEGTSFDEERRLCYVGITRAKQRLFLTRTKNRIRYGKAVPRTPSRFLEEIPKDLMLIQDESHSPDPGSPEQREAHETKVKDFLAQLRAQISKP